MMSYYVETRRDVKKVRKDISTTSHVCVYHLPKNDPIELKLTPLTQDMSCEWGTIEIRYGGKTLKILDFTTFLMTEIAKISLFSMGIFSHDNAYGPWWWVYVRNPKWLNFSIHRSIFCYHPLDSRNQQLKVGPVFFWDTRYIYSFAF